MKIRCLLADDQPDSLMLLKAHCSRFSELEIVGTFTDGHELYERQGSLDYDACFLDIDMPGFDGISLANLLEGKPVVFVSGYSERAVDAYEVEAVDFVPKPVSRARFDRAVERLKKAMEGRRRREASGEGNFQFFPTPSGKTRIDTSRIVAITSCYSPDSDARDKMLFHDDGDEFLLKNVTFSILLEKYLPSGGFMQISKGELINVRKSFTRVSSNTLIFQIPGRKRPLELTLSRTYEKTFKKQFPNA